MLSDGMDEMKFSEHLELQEAWHNGHSLQNNWFYNLTTLKLVNCDIKPYAIPSNILPCLNNLKDLEVRNCNKVEVIFAKTDTDEIPSCLNTLTLENISELTLVWEKNFQGILQFQNLKQVSVIGCKSIQTVFPSVLAENLKMLDKLEVKSCDELREIVGKEDAATCGLEKEFTFPLLTILTLRELPKFTYFYPEIFTVVCPKLSSFFVLDCPKLELFQGAHVEGEAESSIPSTNRQPLIPNLDALSIVEELYLDWKHISVLKLRQEAEDLKLLKKSFFYFDVEKNEKPTLPLDILQKVPSLQELWLGMINSVEIFLTKSTKGREHGILGQLKLLTLDRVSELQYINLEDSWLITVIEKLHDLTVSNCPDLKKLFHSQCAISFSCMKELHISSCPELRFLFTCSMAKVLTTLEKITVEESQSITEIVANEEDGKHSQDVKFERLCYIYLNDLSSLKCFYSGTGSLQLPSLTQVHILQCPKAKAFSSGEIVANLFQGIQASSDSNDQLVFHGDLNASVKRVFLLKVLSEGMDEMTFSEHPELQDAWHDVHNLQNNWFYNLTTLKLVNCDIQPYAIPSNLLPSLKSLKDLEVRDCNKVEVIFAKTDTDEIPSHLNTLTLENISELTLVWEKNFQGILQFQNLKQVSVIGCKSIQTVFPSVLAENLKMLDKLEVKSCDELREIVGKEDAATCGLEKEFTFPLLTILTLRELPKFTYFYPEIFTVVCPKLSSFFVLDCPKLELFQGAHVEGEAESSIPSTNRQPLIPNLDALSILEELYLDWKHISVLKLRQEAEDFKLLKKSFFYFDVERNEKPTLPLDILQKVPSLQELWLGIINSVEIFRTKSTNGREHGILGQLKILTLDRVSELPYINLEDSWLIKVIEKLHDLTVSNCPDLKKLFHSQCATPFSCMKELHISRCNGLTFLFTCSMAKVLTSLEKITVEESQSITEIVAKEDDGNLSQDVKFERLCYIYLNCLSSLKCFYSGTGSLQLPSLTQVHILQCSKVNVFSSGEINANLFQGIQASSDSNDRLVFHNDLNASVKRVFLLQVRVLQNK